MILRGSRPVPPARLILLSALLAASATAAGIEGQRFRMQVIEDGVYRVDYEQLQAAGLVAPVASDRLAVTNRGRSVPIRVEDGGDGRFDAGDRLVFVGEHLEGEFSHYHDYSPFNVYVLSTAGEIEPRRMAQFSLPTGDASRRVVNPQVVHHLERDLLRIPLSGQTGSYEEETLWYWKQLNHLASEATRIPIDLGQFDKQGELPLSLKVQFRGWSNHASSAFLQVPDHEITLALNDTPIGSGSWLGRDTHLIEIPNIRPELVRSDGNELQIRVPLRRHDETGEAIIDVVYLDWVEVTFPHDAAIGRKQQRLRLPANRLAGRLNLFDTESPGGRGDARHVHVYGREGFHADAVATEPESDASPRQRIYEAAVPPGTGEVWVVPAERYMRVRSIEIDQPSNLAGSTVQRDYYIITHPSLADAAATLAEFHDQSGMSTELVDVQDIYDEFNFGIEHPRAIRDFLAHARVSRAAPAASHVLLVGDASWYVKEHAEATAERTGNNERGLIPTWQLRSRDGPAASDNPFVLLDGNDLRPDMAIGRLPASSPAQAHAMVNKTIGYMRGPASGAWRSRALLASDDERNLSARNEQLAERARAAGLDVVEFLARPGEDGQTHQDRFRSLIDEGMLVLHFFGHGGRNMWQTAPSDSGSADNLFDLEDLDRLAPSSRLPIVLSMSCNTGPFDHPAADSLAEKFLRMEDRGAIAVLAASARNSPSVKFTNTLFEGILREKTLGDAVRIAKSERLHPDAAMLYNLFGDPALVPARP